MRRQITPPSKPFSHVTLPPEEDPETARASVINDDGEVLTRLMPHPEPRLRRADDREPQWIAAGMPPRRVPGAPSGSAPTPTTKRAVFFFFFAFVCVCVCVYFHHVCILLFTQR